MINTQPLEITNFTGGITDTFIDGQPNEAERIDNFFFNILGKPQTRWGSVLFEQTQIPIGNFRVSYLEFLRDSNNEDDYLLTFAEREIFASNGNGFNLLRGSSNLPTFDRGGPNSLPSVSEYQDIIFATNSDFSTPQKIFIDDNSDIRAVSAGLPDIPGVVGVTAATGSGANYSYAFILSFRYMVGTTQYLDRGPIQFFPSVVASGIIDVGNGAEITLPTNIPTGSNYDFANINVEIYRTQNLSLIHI